MRPPLLTPEARVVLLTAAGPERDPEILGWLDDRINWTQLFGISVQQRATLPVWRRLSALAPARIPEEIAQPLRRSGMVASFQQLHMEDRLSQAIAALRRDGIRAMLLKGAALAVTVYRSFEDRPMGDVDLLVDPSDALRAQSVLRELGWRDHAGSAHEGFYGDHQHLPPLVDSSGTGATLEVHTELFFRGHPFSWDLESLWRDAREVPFGGGTVIVPSTTHALMHLCTHFAWSHMAVHGAWRTFRDLHAMHDAGAISWDSLCRAAHAARAGTSCYWTLRLARDLAGFDVPPAVLARLAPPNPRAVQEVLARHLGTIVVPMPNSGCPSVRLTKLMWEAALRPRWSGHGEVRPWSRGELALEAFTADAPDRGADKLRAHVARLSAWRDYLRSLTGRSLLSAPAARR